MADERWELEDWKAAGAVIGENVVAYDSFIDKAFPWLVVIGKDTVLTGATILAHDGSTHRALGMSKVGTVTIGERCFVGYGSKILAGVTIGDDCIIGVGAIVTKDIPANSVVVGRNKIISSTDEYIRKHREKMKILPGLDYEVPTREEQEMYRQLFKNGGYAI